MSEPCQLWPFEPQAAESRESAHLHRAPGEDFRALFAVQSAAHLKLLQRRLGHFQYAGPLGAVTFAVQHAQIGAPRTHGRPILVGHNSGDLVQVREVVSCPRR